MIIESFYVPREYKFETKKYKLEFSIRNTYGKINAIIDFMPREIMKHKWEEINL